MTTPGEGVQLLQRVDDPGAQRIEMDIANQFEQIGILIADYRFVAILKQMPAALVPHVENDGIAGQQTTHEMAEGVFARAQEKMDVIVEQRPGKAIRVGFFEKGRKTLQKVGAIHIVNKDRALFNAANNNVLKQTGDIDAS